MEVKKPKSSSRSPVLTRFLGTYLLSNSMMKAGLMKAKKVSEEETGIEVGTREIQTITNREINKIKNFSKSFNEGSKNGTKKLNRAKRNSNISGDFNGFSLEITKSLNMESTIVMRKLKEF